MSRSTASSAAGSFITKPATPYICAALHGDFAPPRIAVLMLKRLLTQLLTFRYYNAALVVLALDHFLQGPSILDRDPRPLHADVSDIRDRYPQMWTRRETVLPAASVGQSPRSVAGFLFAMLRTLAGNWCRPTRPEAASHWLDVRDLVWFRVMTADNLAVETHWDAELPTFRRDRDRFPALLKAGLGGIWRLYRTAPSLHEAFKAAAPDLTSVPFWRRYVTHAR